MRPILTLLTGRPWRLVIALAVADTLFAVRQHDSWFGEQRVTAR